MPFPLVLAALNSELELELIQTQNANDTEANADGQKCTQVKTVNGMCVERRKYSTFNLL